jgi:hypothetical protein
MTTQFTTNFSAPSSPAPGHYRGGVEEDLQLSFYFSRFEELGPSGHGQRMGRRVDEWWGEEAQLTIIIVLIAHPSHPSTALFHPGTEPQ